MKLPASSLGKYELEQSGMAEHGALATCNPQANGILSSGALSPPLTEGKTVSQCMPAGLHTPNGQPPRSARDMVLPARCQDYTAYHAKLLERARKWQLRHVELFGKPHHGFQVSLDTFARDLASGRCRERGWADLLSGSARARPDIFARLMRPSDDALLEWGRLFPDGYPM